MTQQRYPKRSVGSAAAEVQPVDSGVVDAVRHVDQGVQRRTYRHLTVTRLGPVP
ncbi:hypothetical protein J2S90_001732 [Arthrobacter bambusae]|uniref:Uncharacterized protein n=1 Tax=Arthrobacter bambusae TaxID=1338426 RepID=A0AAW8D916_9MICC|nr:hypothetical protein [Arthrobacter bambusae]MDQ0129593.1 hypothetical protein [Arthrobacter bambusae]MDQ0180794.1 hypothetical protein [Arthrobacter bambusae]